MKKIRLQTVIGIVLGCCLVISLVLYIRGARQRRLFLFPVIGTETVVTEVRSLPRNPVQGKLNAYVDELLLGPETQRSRPLFSEGTTCEFCFVRGKTLYVGLSKDVLYEIPEAARISDGIALFKKNIRRNFPSLATIELYIDGKYVEQ